MRPAPMLAAALASLAAASPAHAAVAAYPLPGTTTASPRTQISFRGVAPGDIGTVTVGGSRSGRHPGALRAHSDGLGASFIPSRPFQPGERVTVRSPVKTYGFTIARRPPLPRLKPAELPGVGNGAVQRFATRRDFAPPAVRIDARQDGRIPGYVFLAAKGGRGQDGPMIVDDFGNLVWFNPIGGRELATDFRVQAYQGRPVLTWWQGRLSGGEGRGEGVIYDEHYRPVRRVRAGNGFGADEHEFQLTDRDTALLVIYDPIRRAGYNVVQAVVQEVDIPTGLVLFEWHSAGNIGLAETEEPRPRHGGLWDYVHANSVALDASGDFIVSARHTSAVYRISRATGRILWRLGGERSDFRMRPGTNFHEQHDARPQPDGTLTVFDNGPRGRASRALTIALDTERRIATLRRSLKHPRNLPSATQGNVQALPNGNLFVGWGSRRWFSEYDASGRLVFDGQFAPGGDSYRAYRFPWAGRPLARPDVRAERRGNRVVARVSWNGATGVARWELWAGPRPDALARVKGAPNAGFETAISAPTREPYVALQALDAAGAVLATSATLRVR